MVAFLLASLQASPKRHPQNKTTPYVGCLKLGKAFSGLVSKHLACVLKGRGSDILHSMRAIHEEPKLRVPEPYLATSFSEGTRLVVVLMGGQKKHHHSRGPQIWMCLEKRGAPKIDRNDSKKKVPPIPGGGRPFQRAQGNSKIPTPSKAAKELLRRLASDLCLLFGRETKRNTHRNHLGISKSSFSQTVEDYRVSTQA